MSAPGTSSSQDKTLSPRDRSGGVQLGLDEALELARHGLDELLSQQVDDRTADHHPEHSPEVDRHAVRRPRLAVADVLELPASLDVGEVALLLLPAQPGGLVVRE